MRFRASAGDSVVSKGSFFVRAKPNASVCGRLNHGPRLGATPAAQASSASIQGAKIVVSEKGFEPDKVSLRSGSPARLTFVRTTDKTCATEVVFPSLNIKRVLPLNEPVAIEFTPEKTGDVAFACGMNMLKGVVVVH
jgi:plastocyanin domain-containing protein